MSDKFVRSMRRHTREFARVERREIRANRRAERFVNRREIRANRRAALKAHFKSTDGRGFTSKNVAGLFGVIIVCILAIAIVRILSGRNIITFTGLLEHLASAPTIPTNWLSVFSTNYGETFPSWAQWFGSFIDFLSDIVSFNLYVGTAALNFLSFAFYFLRWLFV